jgi:hypothetical protein
MSLSLFVSVAGAMALLVVMAGSADAASHARPVVARHACGPTHACVRGQDRRVPVEAYDAVGPTPGPGQFIPQWEIEFQAQGTPGWHHHN